MGMRWTEEDLKAYQARQKKQAQAERGIPQGKAVAHLRGSDLSGIAKENPPKVEHHDEVDAWAYAALGAQKVKRNKYGNRRVEIDGMKFDSQHEAKYYFSVLVPRIRAGELAYVLRQVPFELPGGIKYMADFVAVLPGGRIEAVIDAKSEPTRKNRVYINKKKQMKACFGIEILEV